jgi:hypothetical protein
LNPVAVITAKANSERLPGKNMLPLGDAPLAVWSVREALGLGVDTVVSTDIEQLKSVSERMGCRVVHQVPMESHKAVIDDALARCGWSGRPCILLQPTSPFRHGNIVTRCWRCFESAGGRQTVVSSISPHMAVINDGGLENRGESVDLWDGCVAVYPPDRVCEYSPLVAVRNLHLNSLQIDTEEDYVQACLALEMQGGFDDPLPKSVVNLLRPVLLRAGMRGGVTLVGRPDGRPVPQDRPVAYLNHCRGYDGGRCDVLFLIANPNIRKVGINAELRECASRAKAVVVRSNGEIKWLLEALPEIRDKFYPIRDAIDSRDDRLTTGCIAAWILAKVGCEVEFKGLYGAGRASSVLDEFHRPAVSREIALLRVSGAI